MCWKKNQIQDVFRMQYPEHRVLPATHVPNHDCWRKNKKTAWTSPFVVYCRHHVEKESDVEKGSGAIMCDWLAMPLMYSDAAVALAR